MQMTSPKHAAAPKRANRRLLAKERTRAEILAAGRRLFDELGYDAATLRDVAKAAQLSTGAVFGNFANKAALFVGVINADFEALGRRLDAGLSANGHAIDAVVRALTIAQEHHAGSLGLIRSAVAFLWRPDIAAEIVELTGPALVADRIAKILRRGLESGELRLPIDPQIVARQLLSGYMAGYGPPFRALSDEAVRAAQLAQARALLVGYKTLGCERTEAA